MTTASLVRVGVTGAIYGAPTGTALPTDHTTALDAAFAELGYISDAGLRENTTVGTTDIIAWQNGDNVRTIQTSHVFTFALDFMETSQAVLTAFYGNASASAVEVRGEQGIRQSWAFEVVDGTDIQRFVVPDGQITDRGEVSYVNGEAVTYPITITCYPDNTGVKAYKYGVFA